MATRGRKDPALLAPDGDQGPQIDLSPEEAEEHGGPVAGDDIEQVTPTLLYDGELLQTSMTLAVILPGDVKESYFGSRAVLRKQPGEDDDQVASRGITLVRETVISQIDDAIDALAEYQEELQARLNRGAQQ